MLQTLDLEVNLYALQGIFLTGWWWSTASSLQCIGPTCQRLHPAVMDQLCAAQFTACAADMLICSCADMLICADLRFNFMHCLLQRLHWKWYICSLSWQHCILIVFVGCGTIVHNISFVLGSTPIVFWTLQFDCFADLSFIYPPSSTACCIIYYHIMFMSRSVILWRTNVSAPYKTKKPSATTCICTISN